MFADDSCIIAIHKNLDEAINMAQKDLINVQKYFYNNDIYLNDKKTEAMAMGFCETNVDLDEKKIICHTRECLYKETYKNSNCHCTVINYSKKCKYLGVYIDEDFKMKNHVETLSKKLRVLKYNLEKNSIHKLPLTTKKIIYYALIESILRYGVTMYTGAPEYSLKPLKINQKKIIQYLFGKGNEKKYMKPEQLAELTLGTNYFFNEDIRIQMNPSSYHLRNKTFRKNFAFNKYGERKLTFIIPQIFNKYCLDFIDEEDIKIVKKKLKLKILEAN